jgi:hypothetical protein
MPPIARKHLKKVIAKAHAEAVSIQPAKLLSESEVGAFFNPDPIN